MDWLASPLYAWALTFARGRLEIVAYHHDSKDTSTAAGFIDSGYAHGAVAAAVGLIFVVLLQGRGHLPGGILVTLAGVAVCFGIGRGVWRLQIKGAERFGNAIYTPSGDTTAYTPTFSHIEALEIRGDLDGAAAAWDAAIAEQPNHAITLVRAADFHLRARKDASAALEYYLRARSSGGGTQDLKRYVQQKLVDLHLGPLADEGRAMTELRRLIDAFPNTREADGARATLLELKAKRSAS
jgi:hypothetical protein